MFKSLVQTNKFYMESTLRAMKQCLHSTLLTPIQMRVYEWINAIGHIFLVSPCPLSIYHPKWSCTCQSLIFLRVAPVALGQLHGCHITIEVSIVDRIPITMLSIARDCFFFNQHRFPLVGVNFLNTYVLNSSFRSIRITLVVTRGLVHDHCCNC